MVYFFCFLDLLSRGYDIVVLDGEILVDYFFFFYVNWKGCLVSKGSV